MEIIPKKQTRAILPWQNILPYVSSAIFAIAIISGFIIFYLEARAKNNLQDLEDRIAAVGTRGEKAAEKEIFVIGRKIDDFSVLLPRYKKPASFFNFFEEISHPKVWFSELELSLGNDQVQISGHAQNFQILGQQMLIFQNSGMITNTDLSDIAIGKDGSVDFEFKLSLDPKVFQ